MNEQQQTQFPLPGRMGPRQTRWRGSDLLRWEQEKGFDTSDQDIAGRFLTIREVCARYSLSPATVWGWCARSRARSAKGGA
jgi:predicted DNA-binding transcriptional regulator AlpA